MLDSSWYNQIQSLSQPRHTIAPDDVREVRDAHRRLAFRSTQLEEGMASLMAKVREPRFGSFPRQMILMINQ